MTRMENSMRHLITSAALVAIAGCSSATLPANNPSGPAGGSNAASNGLRAKTTFDPIGRSGNAFTPNQAPWKGPVVYVAPTSRGTVYVYPGGDKRPKTALYSFSLYPGLENSLQIDGQKNLYFANSYTTWVYEYAPGTNQPEKKFPTAYTPFEISLRGKTLYVFQAMDSGGYASIAIYDNGSTKVTRLLSDPSILYPQAMAVDKAGNVFVGYGGANFTSGIGEFVHGKGTMQQIDQSVDPSALAIDPAGNLVADVLNNSNTSTMEIYPPGKTSPSASIANLPWMFQFSFTADGKQFYAGDMSGKKFQLYDYPSGKLVYNAEAPDAKWGYGGIAASPAAPVGTW
jgi:hypothetical protein